MHQVTLIIRKTLQPHLGWHGARVAFLALFLIALFGSSLLCVASRATAGAVSTSQTLGQLVAAALRLEDGALLIVATNRAPERAIADYGKRWAIETLFGCLKTRGFCLESTYPKEPERLSRRIALLAIGLCWAFRTGKWLVEQKPIVIKKHGRKAKSIFRYGFDYLRRILLNLEERETDLLQALQFLSCT